MPIFLGKLVIPLGLSPLPVYDELFIAIGLILIISSGFYILKMKTGNKPLILLGASWFIGFIIPAMFIKLPISKVYFDYLEHRAYLPAIGFFITLGVLLNEKIKGKRINILQKTIIPVILIFAALSYNYSGDFTDGVAFFSTLIKSSPGNAFAFSRRGCVYLSRKNYVLALDNFDHSIKVNPIYSDPYYNKGVLYNSLNDPIQAEHFYSIALYYDTLYPEVNNLKELVYTNLSSEKWNLKKYDESKTILKIAISKYPDNSELHYNLGLAYYYSEKFDSAFIEYTKAIEMEKNMFSYYNYKGITEYHLKDFAGALNDFNRALDLNPDFHDSWGSRGMTKIELNDNEGAIIDLTKAINFDPGIGAAYYFRGVAFSKLNRINEARGDRKKATELGYKCARELLIKDQINNFNVLNFYKTAP